MRVVNTFCAVLAAVRANFSIRIFVAEKATTIIDNNRGIWYEQEVILGWRKAFDQIWACSLTGQETRHSLVVAYIKRAFTLVLLHALEHPQVNEESGAADFEELEALSVVFAGVETVEARNEDKGKEENCWLN